MNITKTDDWIFFTNENCKCLDTFKVGKWMVYFSESSREYVTGMCEKAVNENIVPEAKVAIGGDVACLYLNIDEIEYHKKCINFMLENNLIRKTKNGKYYNVSFKKDMQTFKGEYGTKFLPQLKLDDFINLDTGEWIFNDNTKEVSFEEYCDYYLDKLKDTHVSCLERLENACGISIDRKNNVRSNEYEGYNEEIYLCQLCKNAYKILCELGAKKIVVLIPDGVGEVLFTPICTDKPIKLLKEHLGKRRYSKKVSAAKLQKKMKRLNKSIYDINKTTGIRISSLEKYIFKDCTIPILNIVLIASVLECSVDELTQ